MKRSTSKLLTVGAVVVVLIAIAIWGSRTGTPTPSASPTAVVTPFADDKIQLDTPLPGARVSSPLTVSGRVRGTWYFEASFPVTLKNQNGVIIAQVPAQAQSEWMTTGWVPFSVTLTFPQQTSGSRGTLILQKDNPSGLPQYDDSRQITVYFK